MTYLSVCSGIEAASVAWQPLGFTPAAFAEIERFPSAVLEHHHPDVPNRGDMTKFKDWPNADIDLLVGGTPCQSFSVAGLRAGLDDPRGSLMLTYLAIAGRYRPRWLVWENVPGVLSSDKGRAFGSLLGGLAELGYGFAYRILDAQYFRLAQRRRRVFVVGYLGDWRRPAAVLFERESLSGHPAPSREAGERVAGTITGGASSGGHGRFASSDAAAQGLLIPSTGELSHCLNANGGIGRLDYESETFITHALRADGFDASEDGTGRGTPLIVHALDSTSAGRTTEDGTGRGCPIVPVAFAHQTAGDHTTSMPIGLDFSPTLKAGPSMAMQRGMQVRRLTPRECERLQGFPDDYTLIPYRGKSAKDGPRYKALGNSMAVPCMAWIGRRMQMVEEATSFPARLTDSESGTPIGSA